MSIRIRIRFISAGLIEAVNASPERIEVKLPDTEKTIKIRPNSRFRGNHRSQMNEPLPAARPIENEAVYPVSVRRAGPEDIDALLAFVPQVLSETTLLPVSDAKVRRMVERCAHREAGAIAGIIDGPGGVDASVGLLWAQSETSDDPYLKAAWFGVHPEARKDQADENRAHHGKALIDFAKWCHAGLERVAGGPVVLQFDVATFASIGSKVGLFHRQLPQVGATFALGSAENVLMQSADEADEAVAA